MGMYAFLRDQPLRRPADCSVGGVCLAWARALGIRPIFLRLPLLFLFIVTPPYLLFYAAFWLLLPAEADERILLQDLFKGKVHAETIVALAMFTPLFVAMDLPSLAARFDLPRWATLPLVAIVLVGPFLLPSLRARSAQRSLLGAAGANASWQAPTKYASPASSATTARVPGRNATTAEPSDRPGGRISTPNAAIDTSTPVVTGGSERADRTAASRAQRPANPAMVGVPAKSPSLQLPLVLSIMAVVFAVAGVSFWLFFWTFGGWLVIAGMQIIVVGIALAIAGLTGHRGGFLTFISWLMVIPLAGATVIAAHTPATVLHNRAAFFKSGDPQWTAQLEPALIGRGAVFMAERAPDTYHSAYAHWAFVVPPEGNFRFIIRGMGEVKLADYGGWQLMHGDETTRTNPPPGIERCTKRAQARTAGECSDEVKPQIQTHTLRGDDTFELLSPAALSDPQRTKDVHVEFGYGTVIVGASAPPGDRQPARTPSATPKDGASSGKER